MAHPPSPRASTTCAVQVSTVTTGSVVVSHPVSLCAAILDSPSVRAQLASHVLSNRRASRDLHNQRVVVFRVRLLLRSLASDKIDVLFMFVKLYFLETKHLRLRILFYFMFFLIFLF